MNGIDMTKSKSCYGANVEFSQPGIEIHDASCQDFAFPVHTHEEYTVGVIRSGEEIISCRGANVHTGAGQLYFINPDEPHTAAAVNQGGWTYTSLYFHPELVASLIENVRDNSTPKFSAVVSACHRLRDLVLETSQLIKRTQSTLEIEVSMLNLLEVLFRENSQDLDSRSFAHQGSRAEQRRLQRKKLTQAERYLRENLACNVSLGELAAEVGWHPGYLVSVFKRAHGITPHLYLMALRLNAARRALKTDREFSDIALSCGFYDQSHLNRQFKRSFGMTPRQFRSGARNELQAAMGNSRS